VQYLRMCEHVLSLDRLAHSRGTAFGENQIESLDEATVDYLAMWLALLAMIEHRGRDDGRSLRKKLTQVEHQLESSTSAVDRKHLERAQSDLEAMMRRRDSVKSRALSVETAMMAMGDAFEEVYQRIVANPGSASDVNHALEDAVQRLRVEEELDLAVDSELEALLSGRNE
jgi:3-dehydroquinate dehydratase